VRIMTSEPPRAAHCGGCKRRTVQRVIRFHPKNASYDTPDTILWNCDGCGKDVP
jgi:hypothetical protein